MTGWRIFCDDFRTRITIKTGSEALINTDGLCSLEANCSDNRRVPVNRLILMRLF